MLLAEKSTGHLVEISDIKTLFDPNEPEVTGSVHYGEEAQDPEPIAKTALVFPSGEPLPQCWTDPDYRRKQS
ncbi:acetyltransferase [Marinobacter sp. OP 3.4]|uniref:acetyltransferase n=1 Tax=Marinobacter sp. OP 3.4 TaxID=3076501 RepID=UPI002E24E70C